MNLENTPIFTEPREDNADNSLTEENLQQPINVSPVDSKRKVEETGLSPSDKLSEPITNPQGNPWKQMTLETFCLNPPLSNTKSPERTQMKEEKLDSTIKADFKDLFEKKKRLPLPEPPTPVKPAKSLFKQEKRKELQGLFPELQPHLLSKKMTDMYKELAPEEKALYEEQERKETEAYNQKYEEYRQLLKERGHPSPEEMRKNYVMPISINIEEMVFKSKKKLLPHQTEQKSQIHQSVCLSFKRATTEDTKNSNQKIKPFIQAEKSNDLTLKNFHLQDSQKKNLEADREKKDYLMKIEENKDELFVEPMDKATEKVSKKDKADDQMNQSTSNNQAKKAKKVPVVDENKEENGKQATKNNKSVFRKKTMRDKSKVFKKKTRNKSSVNKAFKNKKSKTPTRNNHSRAFI